MLLPVALLGLGFPQTPPAQKPVRKVYTVATAHLDTNWLWTIQDTIDKYIPKTLDENFAYFKKYPDYEFNFEGAFRYMLTKEYYPARYAELKKYIAAGRWNVAGSWICAVDANMPSPESLIRQALYGDGFFKKEFGKRSVDIFLPDCFGFPYTLPAIAQHCGLIGFSTQKLYWGSSVGIPFPVGKWVGVDGKGIVAALDPGSYTTTLKPDFQNDPHLIDQIDEVGDKSGAYVAYRYHGTGDTGGAPAEESVQALEYAIDHPGQSTALSAASDQLYKDITPAEFAKLPSYDGELLLTTHGTGCYTSQAAMKRWNRENENLASTAESSASIADWLGGAPYPTATLDAAWIRFLWHQFHDDLTGTSIPTVYPFSWNDEVLSLNNFSAVAENSLATVAAATDTRGPGVPLVVYNPVSAGRIDAVEATVRVPSDWKYVRVVDADDSETPSQVDSRDGDNVHLVFTANAPSLGVAVYHVVQADAPEAPGPGTAATPDGMEDRDYRITLDSNGDVSSIYDKSTARQLLTGPIRLELRDDPSRNWPSWEIQYDTVRSAPRTIVAGPAKVRVIENGPARLGLEIERRADGSSFTQRIYLAPGSGRIDFPTHVSWHTRGTLLKADFPLAASNETATYDLGLGTIARPIDTPKKYEVPAQKWADQTAEDASFGTSILTDCKYGWDKPDAGHLRLTLLHTAETGRGYRFQATNDLGDHDFTYSVYGHAGDWRNGSWRAAAALNQPLVVLATSPHGGRLPSGFSLISANTPGLQIDAVKKSEDGKSLIVRVFEKFGRPLADAELTFPSAVRGVREVDGQEDPVDGKEPLRAVGNRLEFSLTPYEPRAFAVNLGGGGGVKPVRSMPLALKFDATMVGEEGKPLPAGLDRAIPSTLWPKSLDVEGVTFDLGGVAQNALSCAGQSIALPKNADRVELLVTRVGDDKLESFGIGGARAEMIPSSTKRIAQWTNRVVDGVVQTDQADFLPAYMKRTPVAWVSTHRLTTGGAVESYKYVYVFKLDFRVPKGASELTLPDDAAVKVLAATAIADPKPAVAFGGPLYR